MRFPIQQILRVFFARCFLLILGCLLYGMLSPLCAKVPILSPDGAFALHGDSSFGATHFAHTLADFEKRFYEQTQFSKDAEPPLVIVLHGIEDSPQNHPTLRMDALENGAPKIQIDLNALNLQIEEVFNSLAQAMLLRIYYGEKAPTPGAQIIEIPAWLAHGLGRLCNPGADEIVIPASYLRGARPPTIADLLVQKTPDGSNQSLLAIYDAMCSTLVTAGLKSSGGTDALQSWLGHFDSRTPDHSLEKWPANWKMDSLERHWLLLMAGTSRDAPGVVSLLSVGETMNRYDEIIASIPTKENSFALLKKNKESSYILQALSKRLIALHFQANPLTDSLLDETILLCDQLKHLSEKKLRERQEKILEKRTAILQQSRNIESYLDWYEAAKLPVRSGLFDSFLSNPDMPVSKGPVGRYLDAIEQRGW